MGVGASPALAETHPFRVQLRLRSRTRTASRSKNPRATCTSRTSARTRSHKFDANGNPVEFSALHSNTLNGSATPAGSFSFPDVSGTPAAIAVDNSTEPVRPLRGDLYVMDAGHNVIDKFSARRRLSLPDHRAVRRRTGGAGGHSKRGSACCGTGIPDEAQQALIEEIDLFDNSTTNNLIKQQEGANGMTRTTRTSTAISPPEDSFAVSPPGTTTCSSNAVVRRSSVERSDWARAGRRRSWRCRDGRGPGERSPLRRRPVLRGGVGHGGIGRVSTRSRNPSKTSPRARSCRASARCSSRVSRRNRAGSR